MTVCTRDVFPDMIAFEEAIYENPTDRTNQLVYADWLREHEDTDFEEGLRGSFCQIRIDEWVRIEKYRRAEGDPPKIKLNYFGGDMEFDASKFYIGIYKMKFGGDTLRDAMVYWINMYRKFSECTLTFHKGLNDLSTSFKTMLRTVPKLTEMYQPPMGILYSHDSCGPTEPADPPTHPAPKKIRASNLTMKFWLEKFKGRKP